MDEMIVSKFGLNRTAALLSRRKKLAWETKFTVGTILVAMNMRRMTET